MSRDKFNTFEEIPAAPGDKEIGDAAWSSINNNAEAARRILSEKEKAEMAAKEAAEKLESKFWELSADEQVKLINQIFSPEELARFADFQVQETTPNSLSLIAAIFPTTDHAVQYIKKYKLLVDKYDALKKLMPEAIEK